MCMWFKCSLNLLASPPMRELARVGEMGDGGGSRRVAAALTLMAQTAAGLGSVSDQADLARLLGVTARQASRIWEGLESTRALRPTGDGRYSLREWMIEAGYLGDSRPHRGRPERSGSPRQAQPGGAFADAYRAMTGGGR